MLNEFVVLERGLSSAGFSVTPWHPDVQSPGKSEALQVRLARDGTPTEVSLLRRDHVASLWTLRSGKHSSFPYMQLKSPLLSVPKDTDWHQVFSGEWSSLSAGDRRRRLNELAGRYPVDAQGTWFSTGLKKQLEGWAYAMGGVGDNLASISAVIDRFLQACDKPDKFVTSLSCLLLAEVNEGGADLIEVVRRALVGKVVKQGKDTKVVGSPVYLDVARNQFASDVASRDHVGPISEALQNADGEPVKIQRDCAYAGKLMRLHTGNFPQPTLPVVGQIYLFAKNEEIKAAHRYARSADEAIPVGSVLMQRLAGALDEVTAEHRRGQTWRSVPGERPKKQNDLLLAFVDNALEAPLADVVADDGEDIADDGEPVDSRATFLKRTERVIEAVRANIGADFRKTPATLCILRKVELGNAKAILQRAFTVGELYDAAKAWADAQRNLPDWLQMPVATRAKTIVRSGAPTIAPLQLPRLTRAVFNRAGEERAKREPVGVTAQDSLTLFLCESGAERIACVALRMMLERQGTLFSGAAHALRKDDRAEKLGHAVKYDRAAAALRALGLVAVLLAKLGRRKGNYMSEVAFKLGQLLAVADAVHVGYCTDMRGGDVPPTLLGNSVLATAQSNPTKALAVLSRRWKPYAAWAKRPQVHTEADRLRASGERTEQSRGWAMITAVSQARRADTVCRELHGRLPKSADDVFRAELLLGYVAGLPRKLERTADDLDDQSEESQDE